MSYNLRIHPDAKKEFKKIGPRASELLLKKLESKLDEPHVPNRRLKGFPKPTYKIKSGVFRLVYEVNDSEIIVIVLGVGKRDRRIYTDTKNREM